MAKKVSNELDILFEYGIDADNRTVYLYGDVEEDSVKQVIKALLRMDKTLGDITVYISSYGGSLYDMFALYDIITNCTNKVKTIALGKCMSAAVLLCACGDSELRYAHKNVTFMLHDASDEQEGYHGELKKEIKELGRVVERWAELLANHSKKTSTFYRNVMNSKGNLYINAETALEYGLIDKLI